VGRNQQDYLDKQGLKSFTAVSTYSMWSSTRKTIAAPLRFIHLFILWEDVLHSSSCVF
jgi:hypothetical protein